MFLWRFLREKRKRKKESFCSFRFQNAARFVFAIILPGIGLVHKRIEHAHLFTSGLVRCNRSVKPVFGYLLELHVPGKSRNEVNAILLLCCPAHEVVGIGMSVSPYYYLSVFPLLAELGYQLFELA